jgi:Zn-dependent peptidase ImmA (M78 family)
MGKLMVIGMLLIFAPNARALTIDNNLTACPEGALGCVHPELEDIHIAVMTNRALSRFVLLHEIGHVVDYKRGNRKLTERWADLYASCAINPRKQSPYARDYSSPKQYRKRCQRLSVELKHDQGQP